MKLRNGDRGWYPGGSGQPGRFGGGPQLLVLRPMRLRSSDIAEIAEAVGHCAPEAQAVITDADGAVRTPGELRELSDAALARVEIIAKMPPARSSNPEYEHAQPPPVTVRLDRTAPSHVSALGEASMGQAQQVADLIVRRGRRLLLPGQLWVLFAALAVLIAGPAVGYTLVKGLPWPLALSGAGVLTIALEVLRRWFAEAVVNPARRPELLGVWIDPRPIEQWRLDKIVTIRTWATLVVGAVLGTLLVKALADRPGP